jgi:TetR/AcrR family transcriptional repressor of bet genes
MRLANALLRSEVVRQMSRATSDRGRIHAIVAANFAADFFKPEICNAWLSLCAEVPRNREFARIQRVIHARMRSNLVPPLRALLPAGEIEAAVIGITAMIDGLWLRFGLSLGGLTREQALTEMERYLAQLLD